MAFGALRLPFDVRGSLLCIYSIQSVSIIKIEESLLLPLSIGFFMLMSVVFACRV